MKKEDFPLVEFEGQRLRVVPELSTDGEYSNVVRCHMCAAWTGDHENRPMCAPLREHAEGLGYDCDPQEEYEPEPVIYLDEDRFKEYVVEFVRRRVSS
jgi:hypothetical protein